MNTSMIPLKTLSVALNEAPVGAIIMLPGDFGNPGAPFYTKETEKRFYKNTGTYRILGLVNMVKEDDYTIYARANSTRDKQIPWN